MQTFMLAMTSNILHTGGLILCALCNWNCELLNTHF